ncbi:MAG: hypothetical protein AB1297_05610 [bacterium]
MKKTMYLTLILALFSTIGWGENWSGWIGDTDETMPVYYYTGSQTYEALTFPNSYAKRSLYNKEKMSGGQVYNPGIEKHFDNNVYTAVPAVLYVELTDTKLYTHIAESAFVNTGSETNRYISGGNIGQAGTSGVILAVYFRPAEANPNDYAQVSFSDVANLTDTRNGSPAGSLPTFYAFTETLQIPNQADLISADDLNNKKFNVNPSTNWRRFIWSAVDVPDSIEYGVLFNDDFKITVIGISVP